MDVLGCTDKNICFSGPRPLKLPNGGDSHDPEMKKTIIKLSQQIAVEAEHGMVWFITGIMAGFDVIAGEAVLQMKSRFPHIRLALVAPFRKGYFSTEFWTPDWAARALELCRHRDMGICLHENYAKGIYYERNRYMVEHSKVLICYYNGKGGGTKYTVDYAQKMGRTIHNIFDFI